MFGFFLFVIGIVMTLGTTPIITGNVVLEDVPGLEVVRLLGIVFFVGGILLMAGGREEGDLGIRVYNKTPGNYDNPWETFMITNVEGDFEGGGDLNLRQFARQIREYRKKGDATEIEIVRDDYDGDLERITNTGKGDEPIVAQTFDRVLEGKQFDDLLKSVEESQGIKIQISRYALERAKKDPFIKENIDRYENEIEMISKNPGSRPQEKIGEFNVSPRGRSYNGLRVAWHFDAGANTLFVDDLLYHTRGGDYVDDWARKVNRLGEIKIQNYRERGYEPFSDDVFED